MVTSIRADHQGKEKRSSLLESTGKIRVPWLGWDSLTTSPPYSGAPSGLSLCMQSWLLSDHMVNACRMLHCFWLLQSSHFHRRHSFKKAFIVQALILSWVAQWVEPIIKKEVPLILHPPSTEPILVLITNPSSLGPWPELCLSVNRPHSYSKGHRCFATLLGVSTVATTSKALWW